MPRSVTLVLVDPHGSVLGALPPYDVELPWWQEVSDVVAGARKTYGVSVDVLRLLAADRPAPHGGAVTYLAETASPDLVPGLEQVDPEVARLATAEEPLRAAYARVGGPAASRGWAMQVLGDGWVTEQQRTWNLSAIWRLRSGPETAWLKQVPAFFGHEAAVLAWAGDAVPGVVPRLLARGDQGRMLLEHIEGPDLHEAGGEVRERLNGTAHTLQMASVDATDSLVASGVPDRRGSLLQTWLVERLAGHIEGHQAESLLDSLGDRLAELAGCGLPDTLVHGDSHPGNAIESGDRRVLIDWGDSFVGHPGFDALRSAGGLDAATSAHLLGAWGAMWERSVPGCRPTRAIELLRPLEGLRSAAVYAEFLASIEPTERPFHSGDVGDCLDRAATEANGGMAADYPGPHG